MDGYCGVIYKATNTTNGKCYIGQAISFSERKRVHLNKAFNIRANDYDCHFHRAIRKYDKSVWEREVLEDNIPIENLNFMETSAIYLYGSFGENGYNSDSGGKNGRIIGEETKKKMSDAQKGEKHPNFGKHLPEETRRKISEAARGREPSEETRRKISESKKGKRRPDLAERIKESVTLKKPKRKCKKLERKTKLKNLKH